MNNVLLIKDTNNIRTIALNRPEKRNALDPEIIAALQHALESAAAAPEIRVVILTGEGTAFCAGADLEYLQQLGRNSTAENAEDSSRLMEMLYTLRTFPKPVIARVNGHALAGGCGLALACDIIIAADNARFGFTEVRIGFVPAIIMKIAVEKLGGSKARELLLRGIQVADNDAVAAGIAHYAVPPALLDETVNAIAEELACKCSPQSLKWTKALLDEIASMDIRTAMEHSARINALCRAGEDFRKGIDAFLNKQTPEW